MSYRARLKRLEQKHRNTSGIDAAFFSDGSELQAVFAGGRRLEGQEAAERWAVAVRNGEPVKAYSGFDPELV